MLSRSRSVHQLVCKHISTLPPPPACPNKHAYVLHFSANKKKPQLVSMSCHPEFSQDAMMHMVGSRNIGRLNLGYVSMGWNPDAPPPEHHIFVLYSTDPNSTPNHISEALGLEHLQSATLWSKGGLVVTAAEGHTLTKAEMTTHMETGEPQWPKEGEYCDVLAADLTQVKEFMRRMLQLENTGKFSTGQDDSPWTAQKVVELASQRLLVGLEGNGE